MTKRLLLLSLILVPSLQAQNPKSDSLINAGFKFLDTYSESHDLGDARNAHRAFSEVLRNSPNNARAHLGLGLAYAAVEKQQLDPLGLGDATKPVNNTMAIRHLVDALSGDIDPRAAAQAIVTVARREYDEARMQEALTGLEKTKNQSDAVKSAIAELYIAMYDAPGAERALADAQTVSGARLRGIAQLLQPAKVGLGGKTYLDALAAADSIAMIDFVRDARWLADPHEAAVWQTLNVADLRTHLSTFWHRRALRAGVPTAERLSTHFTRIQHAMQEFSFYRQRIGTRAALTVDPKMDGLEYDVDDRAFTYVRYGEPDERIVTHETSAPPGQAQAFCKRQGRNLICQPDRSNGAITFPHNQTWVYYNIGEKPLAFDFFLLPSDSHGWTLVADVVRCIGGSLPYSEQFLRDRMNVDPRYGQLLVECSTGGGRTIDQARVQSIALPFMRERRDTLEAAVVKENGVQRTKKNVPLMADVLQFAGNENTEVTAVVTWPLNAFTAKDGITSTAFTLTIADTMKNEVVTKDTVLNVRVPPNAPSAVGRVYMRLNTQPGDNKVYHVRVRDLNNDSLVTTFGNPIAVRDLHAPRLTISDIALVGGEGGSWGRNGRKLSLIPRGAAIRNFGAYYEAYGVKAGDKYKTTITFDPKDEGLAALVKKLKGKQSISFTFEGENGSNENVVRELRALQSDLPAGNYVLSIAVEAGGQVARASRVISLPK